MDREGEAPRREVWAPGRGLHPRPGSGSSDEWVRAPGLVRAPGRSLGLEAEVCSSRSTGERVADTRPRPGGGSVRLRTREGYAMLKEGAPGGISELS